MAVVPLSCFWFVSGAHSATTAAGIQMVGTPTSKGLDGRSVTTALPTGTGAGDVLVSVIETYPFAHIYCPTGWTKTGDQVDATAKYAHIGVCTTVAGSNQAAPTASINPPTQLTMVTAAFSGVSTTSPVAAAAGAAGLTSPSVNTTTAGDMLVYAEGSNAWRGVATGPAGTASTGNGNDGGNSQAALSFKSDPSTGPTGAATWGLKPSARGTAAGIVALRPANPGSGTTSTTSATDPPSTTSTTAQATTTTTKPPATTSTTKPPATTSTTAPSTTSTTAPATTTTTAPSSGSCTSPAWSHTSTSKEQNDPAGTYHDFSQGRVSADTWNFPSSGDTQVMNACGWNNWNVSETVGNGGGAVKTYPHSRDYFSPALVVGNMSACSTNFDFTTPGKYVSGGTQFDVGYDIWFDNYAQELMVWTQWQQPSGYPNYGSTFQLPTGTGGANETWGHYVFSGGGGPSGEQAWLRQPTTTGISSGELSGSINLLPIFKDAVARGFITNSSTLSDFQYGVEVSGTSGTQKFSLNNLGVTCH